MSYVVSMLDSKAQGNRVAKVQSIYERLRDQWSDFRNRALKNYEYVVGNQIDPDVREELRKENRPAMVYNLMQPKIVTIAGLLESNKMYMRAIPVNEGDNQLADMHTQLVSDWAMRSCNGVKEITKAALDASIGGVGWINNYWSTKDDIEGKWYSESYDPFMVMFDPDVRRQDQKDWRYLTASGFYTGDEIISIYNDYLDEATIAEIQERDVQVSGLSKNAQGQPLSWVERIWSGVSDFFSRGGNTKSRSTDYTYGMINDYVDSRVGRYRVIEFHDRRTRVRHIFYNAMSRETQELPEQNLAAGEEMVAAKQYLDALNAATGGGWIKRTVVTQEMWITAVCPWLLPNRVLAEKAYPIQGRGFQFKPIFCYDFHPDITKMVSLIDILIDPQDSYNQRRMSFLEWIMDAVNPDYIAPKMSIDAEDLPAWQSKERGIIKFFKAVQGLKPEAQQPLAQAQALQVFAQEDQNLAETLTNITPNTQGQSENSSESGVLFAQKVQRALTALSYFFGNVQAAMKDVFEYTDAGLQAHMDMPRKIRLLNKTNDPYWLQVNMPTLMGVHNDITQGEFDWETDTMQLGETAKQVKFMEALAFIKTIPPELVKWDVLFKLWDSPVADEMMQFAQAMMGMALQAQQQQQQLQAVQGAAGAVSALDQAAAGGVPGAAPGMMSPDSPEMAGRSVIPQGMA